MPLTTNETPVDPQPAASTPMWVWVVTGGCVFMGFSLLVVAGVAVFLVQQLNPSNNPTPNPRNNEVLVAQIRAVCEGDETGLGEEYLEGLFSATKSYLEFDAFPDRSSFYRYQRNLAEGWKYGTDQELKNVGDLIADTYDFLDETGKLTSEDQRQLKVATEAVLAATDQAD